MYRKHLERATEVGIRLLFNFDNEVSHETLMIIILVISLMKLLFMELLHGTTAASIKVKAFAVALIEQISTKRVHEDENERFAFNIINPIKNNFLRKDIWQWPMNKSA